MDDELYTFKVIISTEKYYNEDTTDGCVAFRSGEKPEKWYTTETNYWTLQFEDDSAHGFYK